MEGEGGELRTGGKCLLNIVEPEKQKLLETGPVLSLESLLFLMFSILTTV